MKSTGVVGGGGINPIIDGGGSGAGGSGEIRHQPAAARGSADDLAAPSTSRHPLSLAQSRSQSSLWSAGNGPQVVQLDEVDMESRRVDLKKWSIFAILDKDFLQSDTARLCLWQSGQ